MTFTNIQGKSHDLYSIQGQNHDLYNIQGQLSINAVKTRTFILLWYDNIFIFIQDQCQKVHIHTSTKLHHSYTYKVKAITFICMQGHNYVHAIMINFDYRLFTTFVNFVMSKPWPLKYKQNQIYSSQHIKYQQGLSLIFNNGLECFIFNISV